MRVPLRLATAALVATAIGVSAPIAFDHAHAQSADTAKKKRDKRKQKMEGKRKKIRCVRYSQKAGKDEISIDMRLRNRCSFEVECEMQWELRCDDEAIGTERELSSIATDSDANYHVSASICGEKAWEVADVRWSCVKATE